MEFHPNVGSLPLQPLIIFINAYAYLLVPVFYFYRQMRVMYKKYYYGCFIMNVNCFKLKNTTYIEMILEAILTALRGKAKTQSKPMVTVVIT